MDIEEFYDADPRRRESEEIEFGREWSDANGMRTEMSWVADTGELYAMAEPAEPVYMDPVGDTRVDDLAHRSCVTVEVLGVVPDRARLDQLLDGWEQEMEKPNSIQWVQATASLSGLIVDRVRRAAAIERTRSGPTPARTPGRPACRTRPTRSGRSTRRRSP